MDKTGCFLAGAIAGAVALGATAYIVESDDFGWGRSSLPSGKTKEVPETGEDAGAETDEETAS